MDFLDIREQSLRNKTQREERNPSSTGFSPQGLADFLRCSGQRLNKKVNEKQSKIFAVSTLLRINTGVQEEGLY